MEPLFTWLERGSCRWLVCSRARCCQGAWSWGRGSQGRIPSASFCRPLGFAVVKAASTCTTRQPWAGPRAAVARTAAALCVRRLLPQRSMVAWSRTRRPDLASVADCVRACCCAGCGLDGHLATASSSPPPALRSCFRRRAARAARAATSPSPAPHRHPNCRQASAPVARRLASTHARRVAERRGRSQAHPGAAAEAHATWWL